MMWAYDDITTKLYIEVDDLRKQAHLPKEALFRSDVEVSKDRDGNVVRYTIKVGTTRYRDCGVKRKKRK